MNRQQRRAQERQKDKDLQKKIKQQISIMEKSNIQNETLEMAKWVQGLSNKEAECCNRLLRKHTRAHIEDFSIAFQEVIENFLIEQGYENHEELMIQFTNDLEDTGIKVNKIENEGGNYYMSINKDKEKIIADYNNKIQEGLSEREAIEDIMTKYSKYSKSSIKNIIKTCKSNTCPMKKDNGECGNKVVTEEKEDCMHYTEDVKVEKMNNEERAKIFFNQNKDKDKKTIITECASKLGIKESSIDRYYFSWKKENNIVENTEKEVKNDEKVEEKMGFKVLKKVVVLDLEGQCGKYHVENNSVTVNGQEYRCAAAVDNHFRSEEEDLAKKLIELRKEKEEIKQVFQEYVEG